MTDDPTNNPKPNTIIPEEPPPEPIVTNKPDTLPAPAEELVNQILSTPQQPPVAKKAPPVVKESPPSTFQQTNPEKPKPKSKYPTGMIASLVIFLGVIATGTYYISKSESLADTRSYAAIKNQKCAKYGNPKKRQECDVYVEKQKNNLTTSQQPANIISPAPQTTPPPVDDPEYAEYMNKIGTKYDPDVVLPYKENGYTYSQVHNLNTTTGNNKAGAWCGGPCPQEWDSDVAGYYKIGDKYFPIEIDFSDKNEDKDKKENTTNDTTPICTNIKVYKDGVQVTPSTLLPGDIVTIAVIGTKSPTKARFRINGQQLSGDTDTDPNWTVSINQNASAEYFVTYTIPTGVTTFLFEAETFAQGAWH